MRLAVRGGRGPKSGVCGSGGVPVQHLAITWGMLAPMVAVEWMDLTVGDEAHQRALTPP